MAENSTNPLIEIIHERYIERPDSLCRHRNQTKADWHPVAAAISKLAGLLCSYGYKWNHHEKAMYRRAILSVKHPCCPTCGKPMTENVITDLDGVNRKSWFCAVDQNF